MSMTVRIFGGIYNLQAVELTGKEKKVYKYFTYRVVVITIPQWPLQFSVL